MKELRKLLIINIELKGGDVQIADKLIDQKGLKD